MQVTMFENNPRFDVVVIDFHLVLHVNGAEGSLTLFVTHENKEKLMKELRKAIAQVEVIQRPAPLPTVELSDDEVPF